ncbi:MAG: SDR family oxidoreductase [Bacteroidales bacterium]
MSKTDFTNKVIWITGSSSGIGEACAYEFARKGARLILTALEADILENVKTNALHYGAKDVCVLPFDLSQKEGLPQLAQNALESFGSIDVFYNNAGISQRASTVDTEMRVFNKVMDINFFAPVILTKAILPSMLAQGGGQLVITTSISGRVGFPLRSAYCSSKHALYGFFETIQAEYYKDNIRVSIVCPGRVQTNISVHALEKDGKAHGVLDAGQKDAISPQKAAIKIVRAIAHKKREVLIGRKELLMVYFKRFVPGLCARLARGIKSM